MINPPAVKQELRSLSTLVLNNQVSRSMAMSPKISFLRQKMARHCCFFFPRGRRHLWSPPDEGNLSIQSHASCKITHVKLQAGRMYLWSILMTLPWYPAHDSLWETTKKVESICKNKAAVLLCTGNPRVRFPRCSLGGTTWLSWRCQYQHP